MAIGVLVMPTEFGQGFQTPQITVKAIVRASTKIRGQIVRFDFENLTTGVNDNNMDGGTDSGFANVIDPNATTALAGIFGVVEGPAAGGRASVLAGAEARVTMWGVTQANCKATATLVKGDQLVVDVVTPFNSLTTNATTAGVDRKVVAIAMAGGVITSTTLVSVWFIGGLPFGAIEA